MRKQIMLIALCAASIAAILSLGACKGKASAGTSSGVARVKGALPISDGKTTLTVFLGESGDANVVGSYNYADNAFTKRVTDETGIKLDITVGTAANRVEQLNVLLSSGSYPEVIINDGISYNALIYYSGQGIFLPLDEYDPLSYPNIKAAFDEYPALNQKLRGADGKLYGLPTVNDCLHCIYSGGRIWYRMPWIRDNGLKMPETLAEFTDYLRYVKTHDVNGNGKNDEIPMAFEKGQLRNFVAYFAKPFMPFVLSGSYFGLALDNKKVVEQYKDPRFRESLKYLAGIYKEGLILPDSFSMTTDQLRSLTEADTPILAIEAIPWMNNYHVQPSVRWIETFNLPPLIGPDGKTRNAGNQDPWSILGGIYYITDKCKDPELAIALYDYFIKFDVMLDGYIGPKGESWVDADAGTVSILNTPASHRLLATYGTQPYNKTWDQAAPMIRNKKFRLGEQATGVEDMLKWLGIDPYFASRGDPSLRDSLTTNLSYTNEGMWYLHSTENAKYMMPQDVFIPPIALSDDDNARISDINAVLATFIDQAMVEYITGIRNINNDSDWNNYLSEIDRYGSSEMVGLLQKYIK
jgi:putative aldouronate transport system substrate-binding protein